MEAETTSLPPSTNAVDAGHKAGTPVDSQVPGTSDVPPVAVSSKDAPSDPTVAISSQAESDTPGVSSGASDEQGVKRKDSVAFGDHATRLITKRERRVLRCRIWRCQNSGLLTLVVWQFRLHHLEELGAV